MQYIGFCWDKKSISYFFLYFLLLLAKFRKKGKIQNSQKFRKLSNFEGFQIASRCEKKGNQKKLKIEKVARFHSILRVYTVSVL
jgi:hypothetical protein